MMKRIVLQAKCYGWLGLLLLGACSGPKTYEHTVHLKEQRWLFEKALLFPFQIKEHALRYDIHLCVRYTVDYPFQNLHINYSLTDEHHDSLHKAIKNYALFDTKTGAPLGKGWSKTKSHKFLIVSGHQFSQPGSYILKLVQFMRVDMLPGIQSISISIVPQKPSG